MIKTEFEFDSYNVIAYGRSADGLGVEGLVVKYVDENGERIFPEVPRRVHEEIEEEAMEKLMDEQFSSELRF